VIAADVEDADVVEATAKDLVWELSQLFPPMSATPCRAANKSSFELKFTGANVSGPP